MMSTIPEAPSTFEDSLSPRAIGNGLDASGETAWKHLELDLSSLEPIYVLNTHISTSELHDLEDKLLQCNASLTYDPSEAKIFLTEIRSYRRIQLELRSRKLYLEPVDSEPSEPPKKRAKIDSQETLSPPASTQSQEAEDVKANLDGYVQILKVDWLKDTLTRQRIQELEPYRILDGRRGQPPPPDSATGLSSVESTPKGTKTSILERAREDAPAPSEQKHQRPYYGHRSHPRTTYHRPPLPPPQASTGSGDENPLPPAPDWVKKKLVYACQRRHPRATPNATFIALLKRIRLARTLLSDEIGVRAYSTAIASLCAYPHAVRHPSEVERLPGCDGKISALWQEWHETGGLEAVRVFEEDEEMKVLRLFYDIWGVGATTARQFYARGWRDLDDVVEYGWSTLSRVQQIGVKFYDEFQIPIPREEVQRIADVVLQHGRKVRDDGVEAIIVGGYRKMKPDVMDVDIILTHRELDATSGLATDVLASLEESGYVTHTLILGESNSARGQSTLPYRGVKPPGSRGTGFDTLDKALVVWQDPHPTEGNEEYGSSNGSSDKQTIKNPHRRVDIIISPWRTLGCAVLGWSADTTFERDLRRYAKHKKNWKFDSSGIRSRGNGAAIQAEGPDGVQDGLGWLDAEKKVFEALELEYVPPEDRCTG